MSKVIMHELYGEYCEQLPWKIVSNYRAEMLDEKKLCCHAKLIGTSRSGLYVTCIIPMVVVAQNEGGHNSTAVCLDCIRDATT